MSVIVQLTHSELAYLDQVQLRNLYQTYGRERADIEIDKALEILAVGLVSLKWVNISGETEYLSQCARSISAVANKIGMTSLGSVARDVLDLADGRDEAGLRAALARLERVAERSLAAVWDAHNVSV